MDTKGEVSGQVVAGRYEVIRPLGSGGMGKVFLVLDRETGAKRAMKMIRSQYQYNERAIARFNREVEAVRHLNHPGIVKIFDARRDEDRLFYTMEFIEGKSLHDWLVARKRLGFNSAVRVLALVAHALEHAHQVTIHRDISPDNIMVLHDGSVRLLDFGLAKLDDANAGLTMVGAKMGKIQYSAPEQRRNAAEVDARADLYSLGIIFFETLAGHRPKPGMKLSALRPDLPIGCDAFFEKAAAENPDDRFQSAAEFRKALMDLYHASQTTPPPIPAGRIKVFFAKLLRWFR
jgi:serine/threonine-protein kinase